MRRWTTLCLILAVLVAATGCSHQAAPPKLPVTFYYPASDVIYDGKTGIIHSEIRESSGYEGQIEELLDLYFQGPVSSSLRSPFPRHVTVSRYATTANTAILELSSEFAQLGGIDLTLACACIANTLFDLTQLERVHIIAMDSLLDGQASIDLNRDDIFYVDIPSPAQNPSDATASS